MNLENFKHEDWLNYGQWEQPLFSASYWVHWYNKELCEEAGLKNLNGQIIMLNGYTIVDKEDLKKIKSVCKQAFDDLDKSFLKRYKKMSLRVLKEFQKWLKNSTTQNFNNRFKDFLIYSEKVMTPWYLSVVLSDYAGELLVEKAREFGFSDNEIMNCLPDNATLMIKEQREAIKIKGLLARAGFLDSLGSFNFNFLEILKNKKTLYKKILQHVKKYEWVGTHHFWGESLTVEKFLNEIKNYKSLKKTTHKKIKLPTQLKIILQYSADLMYVRQYSPEIFDLAAYKSKNFLVQVAEKLGLTYSEMLYLTPREVNEYLQTGKQINFSAIPIRKNNFCILNNKNKEIIFQEEDVNYFKNIFVTKIIAKDELSGLVAFKGKVSGKVKVFLVPENLTKMETGDILVTPMTTPDFVPLMQKAGGIITDIGGLLSHAAIISRELKKPCIIGTKIATKMFKDGDLVEVDADKGAVRKL